MIGIGRVAMSIMTKAPKEKKDNEAIIIVSGLPRCGTSMMMQMLEAGGVPIVTDHVREADEDNPRGYYEFEKAKLIKEDFSWLDDCVGKVFKMVSALLYHLPPDKKFKVIFMKRNLKEMLASQRAMLQRLGQDDNLSDEVMRRKYEKHLNKVEEWLKSQGNMQVIYVNYNEAIQNPSEYATIVNQFLDERLDEEKMVSIVQTSLYRQRN